ncbi:hypothetical protein BDK51DRAFT_28627 [Blyttiomyces helicus]|uniref:Uncharacterized protein n=1 Tax=Blyttiomyces helicus TaxID=388810 RepID=A0A4P9WC37_9FUNG|nr:hypothetical protein BDK51DRAFT_28627 [Blyttiomyces helicus]|eukprot:RKO90211.1 hypothetical protein BDK51DRAFT_28627 [Blyttiomyces helicus]
MAHNGPTDEYGLQIWAGVTAELVQLGTLPLRNQHQNWGTRKYLPPVLVSSWRKRATIFKGKRHFPKFASTLLAAFGVAPQPPSTTVRPRPLSALCLPVTSSLHPPEPLASCHQTDKLPPPSRRPPHAICSCPASPPSPTPQPPSPTSRSSLKLTMPFVPEREALLLYVERLICFLFLEDDKDKLDKLGKLYKLVVSSHFLYSQSPGSETQMQSLRAL